MESDNIFSSANRFDLSNLLEFTEGDKKLALKYIGIFINAAPAKLDDIQSALARADCNLLYSALHTLKPQLELIGVKNAFSEVEKTLAKLRESRAVDDAIKASGAYIFDEITLACGELELFKNNAFKGL